MTAKQYDATKTLFLNLIGKKIMYHDLFLDATCPTLFWPWPGIAD
jgi:hypothetical protein